MKRVLAATACATALAGHGVEPVGRLAHSALSEVSGIVKSEAGEFYWVHNDSGDSPRLFALDPHGTPLKPPYIDGPAADWDGHVIENAWHFDWEDIALADGTLYVADVGNNGNARRDLGVYVIAEPDPRAIPKMRARAFLPVRYPDQHRFPAKTWHFDCEAVFVANGRLHFITKHRQPGKALDWAPGAKLYRLDTDHVDRDNVLTLVGRREDVTLATGGRPVAGRLPARGRDLCRPVAVRPPGLRRRLVLGPGVEARSRPGGDETARGDRLGDPDHADPGQSRTATSCGRRPSTSPEFREPARRPSPAPWRGTREPSRSRLPSSMSTTPSSTRPARTTSTWPAIAGPGPTYCLLGMNPGPFGMVQTGVPFGEVASVRTWLGIESGVEPPRRQHPKRPVQGFACTRNEVSGSRLWGWARDRFGTPDAFFQRFFVWNYCPLAFLEASGRNRTPDRLPPDERRPLFRVCDRALWEIVDHLQPSLVLGVGRWSEGRARAVLADRVPIGHVLHPSPASPAANRGLGGRRRGAATRPGRGHSLVWCPVSFWYFSASHGVCGKARSPPGMLDALPRGATQPQAPWGAPFGRSPCTPLPRCGPCQCALRAARYSLRTTPCIDAHGEL